MQIKIPAYSELEDFISYEKFIAKLKRTVHKPTKIATRNAISSYSIQIKTVSKDSISFLHQF